jgi:hypothetical protein
VPQPHAGRRRSHHRLARHRIWRDRPLGTGRRCCRVVNATSTAGVAAPRGYPDCHPSSSHQPSSAERCAEAWTQHVILGLRPRRALREAHRLSPAVAQRCPNRPSKAPKNPAEFSWPVSFAISLMLTRVLDCSPSHSTVISGFLLDPMEQQTWRFFNL